MGEPSSSSTTSAAAMESSARIESLVLDAGPLVTQSPLRGLAKKYYIPPSVVAELKDKRAKDHFEWLQSEAGGCEIEVHEPGPEAMVAVIAFAKQTGDYSVLSRPDLSVLALTYALEFQKHGSWRIRDQVGGKTGQQKHTIAQQMAKRESGNGANGEEKKKQSRKANAKKEGKGSIEAVAAGAEPTKEDSSHDGGDHTPQDSIEEQVEAFTIADKQEIPLKHAEPQQDMPADPDDDEDDEETGGEWITPENITKHKNRALGLVTDDNLPPSSAPTPKPSGKWQQTYTTAPADDGWSTVVTKKGGSSSSSSSSSNGPAGETRTKKSLTGGGDGQVAKMSVACMTGDYAVQNVLLQMGLSLVGIQGQRISQVKSWVLRCHACFKICKDSDKKFCPQCGNPTLLRTSVTSTAPDLGSKGGGIKVHLKKNFQYKNRGTIYSLPLPKQGRAGGAPQSVPILREDQAEWQKAVNAEKIKRNKEERALQKALERGSDSLSARYEDADELSMLLAGGNAKNRSSSTGLPSLGVGRKNPNERRRRKV